MRDLRGQPHLRASDAERTHVAELLAVHAAAGRLDAAEHEERTGRALRARTRGELAALLSDLPRARTASDEARRRARRVAEARTHVGTYLVVIAGLWLIWALTGGGYAWPVWPMLGWGLAVAGDAASALRGRAGSLRLPPG